MVDEMQMFCDGAFLFGCFEMLLEVKSQQY